MKNKYIIIGSILLGMIVILLIILSFLMQKTKPTNNDIITNTPTFSIISPVITPNSISVVSTSPSNRQKDVSLKPTISITFNKTIFSKDILFSIAPSVEFSQQINNNILTIIPSSNLQPGTLYTYIVKFPPSENSTSTYTFTTAGPTQQYLPDTRPTNIEDLERKEQLESAPDVYVTNLLPYSNESFAAESEFSSTPTGHFKIIVTLQGSDKNAAKNNFIAWLKTNGLNDSHISRLDIEYH